MTDEEHVESPIAVDDAPPAPVVSRSELREEQRLARRRKRFRLLAASILAAFALVFVAVGWFVWQLDPPGDAGGVVIVDIQPGWGVKEAGDELQHRGVIGSSLAFQLWARLTGARVYAGLHELRMDMGVRDALDGLGADDVMEGASDRLLLPPGLTMAQIADRVGRLPGHDRDTFLAAASSGVVRSKYQPEGVTSLEGLTWPDTYFVDESRTDQQILEMIVGEFDRRADALGLAVPGPSGLTPYEAIVSASLIQGEAGGADQPIVSGVIVNRLRRGMPLQIDATLCYAKGGCPPVPSNADKQIDSPYNTYRVSGLPPTPILSVTESALRAALAPASHAFVFYVTGDDGVTRFAETLDGHEANIRDHGVRGE
jgi:UPF0755 protein